MKLGKVDVTTSKSPTGAVRQSGHSIRFRRGGPLAPNELSTGLQMPPGNVESR